MCGSRWFAVLERLLGIVAHRPLVWLDGRAAARRLAAWAMPRLRDGAAAILRDLPLGWAKNEWDRGRNPIGENYRRNALPGQRRIPAAGPRCNLHGRSPYPS